MLIMLLICFSHIHHIDTLKCNFDILYKNTDVYIFFYKLTRRMNYLSAIGCFGLQVVECDKFPEQTALLVASLHSAKLKIRLWLEEDESQVDGKAGHVDGKGPMGVEHRLPAIDLSSCVDLGRLVPQAAHKGHRPH